MNIRRCFLIALFSIFSIHCPSDIECGWEYGPFEVDIPSPDGKNYQDIFVDYSEVPVDEGFYLNPQPVLKSITIENKVETNDVVNIYISIPDNNNWVNIKKIQIGPFERRVIDRIEFYGDSFYEFDSLHDRSLWIRFEIEQLNSIRIEFQVEVYYVEGGWSCKYGKKL